MLNEFVTILQIVLYPILTLVILLLLGFGLTQILIPKNLRAYSLWLSPWFAIIFIIITSIVLGFLNISLKYTAPLIILVLMLINFIVLSKTKLRYSFLKEDIIIGIFIIINIVFNLSPLIIRDKLTTAVTFGNNDVINYVVAAEDVSNHSLYEIFMTPLDPGDKSHTLIRGGYRWGPGLLTAFFQYIFRLEAFQYAYIMQVVLFAISIPLLYLLFKSLYKSSILGLVLILVTMGLNVNLLYMLYNNFFGQVLFWGLELFSLFFIFAYFSDDKKTDKFNKYELIIGVSFAALFFSYHEGLIFVILPLIIFLFLRLSYFHTLLRIFIVAFLISSYAIFNALAVDYLQAFAADPNQPIGWELFRNKLPYANPYEMIGVYSIHSFKPLPLLLAVFLSILTIIIMFIGYQKSKGKLLLGCFLLVYIAFLIWMGVLLRNFFAYNRALTYVLPLFLLLFSIGVVRFYKKQALLVIIIFLIIISLEVFSGLKLNYRFIKGRLSVDKSLISIREIAKTKIKGPIYSEVYVNKNLPIWYRIWMEHFLYSKTKFQPSPYDHEVPDNGLLLISKPSSGLISPQVLFKSIVWENEYYKLGRLCNSDECLIESEEDLSKVEIGKSVYEDSLLINGWSVKEPESRWAVSKESTLRLVSKEGNKTRLVVEALTLKEPQELSVYINDQLIGKQSIKVNWQEYSFDLPEQLSKGVYNIKFVYANTYRPVDLGISPDMRDLSINFKKIQIE